MTNATVNYEKYLAGEPLNEQLAALRRGEDTSNTLEQGALQQGFSAILEAFGPRLASPGEEDRPLSREERLTLKEAQQGGGVTTLTRLLRKSLRAKIQLAILNSENDPLGRSSEIAQDWAYISVYRRLILEVEGMVRAAIDELEQERGQA